MMLTGTGTRDRASQKSLNYHQTPIPATQALMKHEHLPDIIWEPMAGGGAIVNPLRAAGHTVVASDIVDRGCPDCASGVDFLKVATVPPGVQAIVTNPPFNCAEEIIYHAVYELNVPKVYALLRLAFLEGGNLKSYKGHCRRCILDGGHLAKVLLFRKRLPMMHREHYSGKKNSNSGMPFAWFVIDKTWNSDIIIKRIDWNKMN